VPGRSADSGVACALSESIRQNRVWSCPAEWFMRIARPPGVQVGWPEPAPAAPAGVAPNLVNPTTFTVRRSAARSNAVGGTVTLTQTGLNRVTTYYYQILARNLYGDSIWVNLNVFPITTP
jgi:hypothetical protein